MNCTTIEQWTNSLIHQIISSSDAEEINEAWSELMKLKEDDQIIIAIDTVRFIMIRSIKNFDQTPKLLDFFSHTINENPFEVNDTANINCDYKNFLKPIVVKSKNLNLLCHIIEILLKHRNIYLPNYKSIGNFCEAMVHCLSSLCAPHDYQKIIEFNKQKKMVYNHLCNVINLLEKRSERQNLIFICTSTLYKIITETDHNSTPSVALTVIVQLVEEESIPQTVDDIISKSSNDEHLSQLVSVLLKWLVQLSKDNTLFMWIEKFIEGLQNKCRFKALNSLSNNCLKSMLHTLKFPLARIHIMPLICSILIHMSTPKLFHEVIKDIENMFLILKNEQSESASICIQHLVDCVTVLMVRFPDYPCYQSLEKSLPTQSQFDVASLKNIPLWIENNKLIVDNYKTDCGNNKRVGLNNLGNTCYMNSVLQALVMTSQFRDQILAYDDNFIIKNGIIYELQRLFALLSYSHRTCLSPIDFSRASKPTYFTPGQQHDSSEFLCHLLDVLYEQERTTTANKNKISDVAFNDESSNSVTITELQKNSTTIEDNTSNECDGINYNVSSNASSITQSSLVHRVFGGESNTTYQCHQCHESSHNNDHYWELQLSFPEEITGYRSINMQDLINYYLTPEKLTGDNMYHCNRCNRLCDAQRIIQILRAPAHLILTLKHFHYDIDSRLRKKLFHNVDYNEIIKIPVLNNGENDYDSYQLYAAVVHSGYTMDYGHYFTYARDRTDNWYKFNDSCVSKTTLNDFFKLQAPYSPYILFYEKIVDNALDKINEKPILTTLSKNIRNFIEMDTVNYQNETKNYIKNRLIGQYTNDDYYQLSTSLTRQRDNSDDDNPPPTNCRDSIGIQSNRFLY